MRKIFITLCFFMGATFFSSSPLFAASDTDTIQISINPTAKRQTVEGWGISLCWWANMCGRWSDDKINELVDWLVSPDGLNYNVFRYNIVEVMTHYTVIVRFIIWRHHLVVKD